jgi:hypothetical protein
MLANKLNSAVALFTVSLLLAGCQVRFNAGSGPVANATESGSSDPVAQGGVPAVNYSGNAAANPAPIIKPVSGGATPTKVTTDNKNTLIQKYQKQLQANASSAFGGYGVERALDGNPFSSWFSRGGDAASLGTSPWVEVAFPENLSVKRVTILGNRHSPYLTNYSVTEGRLELFDQTGKQVLELKAKGSGPAFDFDFQLPAAVADIRRIRFTSIADQGNLNAFKDIALGEIQVE